MIAHHDNTTEAHRQTIQSAIDATKSAAERNRLGQRGLKPETLPQAPRELILSSYLP